MLNVIILGITSLLTDISTEMVYPIVPLYLTLVLGAQPVVIGLIDGFAESIASLLKVFSGQLSDRLGRRKLLAVSGYAGSPLGKLLLYLSASWGLVFAGRLVDRVGKGIRTAPRDALIADSVAPERRGRAFGLHRALDTIGAAIGVFGAWFILRSAAIGATVETFKRLFLLSLVPAALGVIILLGVRETRSGVRYQPERLSAKWRALPRRLKLFLLVVLLFALGNSSNQFLILRATHFGFTPADALLLYLVYNLTYALLAYPAGRLSDRIGRKRVLVTGYLFYGAVYLGFALAPNPVWIWGLFVAYGVFSAFNEGIEKAFIADVAPPKLRGTMIGLHATLTGIGLFPASLLAGALMTWQGPAPFYFGGALGLLAALGLVLVL